MKSIRYALAVAALSGGLAGTATAQAPTKILVLHTGAAPYMTSFVAKDQGFFSKRGLDVDFAFTQNGSIGVSAVVAGSAQISIPTAPIIVQAVDSGVDLVAIASNNEYPETTHSGLIVREGAGIKTLQDLVGKRVGVPGLGGFLDVVLRKFLTDKGVDIKKINFVEVGLPQAAEVLKSGQVDAVGSVDPFLGRAVSSGAGHVIADYSSTLPAGTITGGYATTREWATAHADAVTAFQQALVEALAYIKTHDASARESLARYTKLPPPVVASLPIPHLTLKLKPEQFAFWINVLKEQGGIKGNPDPAKIVWPWKGGE